MIFEDVFFYCQDFENKPYQVAEVRIRLLQTWHRIYEKDLQAEYFVSGITC